MRLRLLSIPLGALVLATTPVHADRLILSIEQDVTHQSNLFKTPDDEESDAYYRVRPGVAFQGEESTFRYDLVYRPSFDFYFDNSDLDDDSHYGRGKLSWKPMANGELTLGGEVSHYRTVRSDDVEGDGVPDALSGRDGRVTKAVADFGYEHYVQRDWIAATHAGVQSYTFTDRESADSLGFDGEASLIHELRPNLALGGLLFGSQRSFDEQQTSGTPRSRNLVLNGSLVLRAEPFRSTTFEVRGGPALIAVFNDGRDRGATVDRFRGTDAGPNTTAAVFDPARCATVNGQFALANCPVEPAPAAAGQLGQRSFVEYDPGTRPRADDEVEVTGFVQALLRREDRWGEASVEYSRWEEASAGISATTIRDSVTGTVQFEPGDWVIRARANWNQREDVTRVVRSVVRAGPSPVPSAGPFFVAEANGLVPDSTTARITQYWVDLQVTRYFLEDRLAIEVGGRYVKQDRSGFGASVDFDNTIGTVGLRYEFRPVHYLQ